MRIPKYLLAHNFRVCVQNSIFPICVWISDGTCTCFFFFFFSFSLNKKWNNQSKWRIHPRKSRQMVTIWDFLHGMDNWGKMPVYSKTTFLFDNDNFVYELRICPGKKLTFLNSKIPNYFCIIYINIFVHTEK